MFFSTSSFSSFNSCDTGEAEIQEI